MNPHIERVVTGLLEENCWLLRDPARDGCLVIDPGDDPERIRSAMRGCRPAAVLLTPRPLAHTGAAGALAADGAELLIHEADAPLLTDPRLNACRMIGRTVTAPPASRTFRGGETLTLAGIALDVIHTPGHTPGSCCFVCGDVLFTGDTVMAGGVGRTDLPGGSEADLRASLRRLLPLLRTHTVCGGHGS